jgi:hypothetical protein
VVLALQEALVQLERREVLALQGLWVVQAPQVCLVMTALQGLQDNLELRVRWVVLALQEQVPRAPLVPQVSLEAQELQVI